MDIKLFIRQELFKIITTAIVVIFFLYFWIEGPLQQFEQLINLEHVETEFSIPKLVGELTEKKKFSSVSDVEKGGFGHSLITNKKEEESSFGIITSSIDKLKQSELDIDKLLVHAKELFGKKASYSIINEEELTYVSIEGDGKLIYLESKHFIHGIRGYAGEINVGMFIDENGEIYSLHHISSKETESYLQKISSNSFYEQFIGLELEGDNAVDAVSGATLTTEAIARTTSSLVEKGTPSPLVNFADVNELDLFFVEAKLSNWWILHIVIIFLIFLFGYQKRIKKSKKSVVILSILSVIYIGFFLNNSFTYVSFIHPFVGTSISLMVGIYSFFTLLGAIWGKNTYCKYVCPFGNTQRLVLQITPKKFTSKFFISNKWINRIRGGIAISIIIGVLMGIRSWNNFELFPDLFGFKYDSIWAHIAVLSIVIAMRYPMIWCRLLCPTGSVLDFVSDLVNYKPSKFKLF